MISLSEKDLATYLDIRDSRWNGRLLADRVFRGVVKSATFVGGWQCMITVQRIGDTIVDLTRYSCSIPGYIPLVGDTVDLFWRSRTEAIVLEPVSSPGSIVVAVAGQTPITFRPTPCADRTLQISFMARSFSDAVNGSDNFFVQVNGDTGANYTYDGNSTQTGANTPYS